jgi:hypothetical protein
MLLKIKPIKLMNEKYKIEIESKGEYDVKKEFNKLADLNEREYMGLITVIPDYLDTLPLNDKGNA